MVAFVFLYQITFFPTKHTTAALLELILMTIRKLWVCTGAAAVAVNKERSPMGPMWYLQTPLTEAFAVKTCESSSNNCHDSLSFVCRFVDVF